MSGRVLNTLLISTPHGKYNIKFSKGRSERSKYNIKFSKGRSECYDYDIKFSKGRSEHYKTKEK